MVSEYAPRRPLALRVLVFVGAEDMDMLLAKRVVNLPCRSSSALTAEFRTAYTHLKYDPSKPLRRFRLRFIAIVHSERVDALIPHVTRHGQHPHSSQPPRIPPRPCQHLLQLLFDAEAPWGTRAHFLCLSCRRRICIWEEIRPRPEARHPPRRPAVPEQPSAREVEFVQFERIEGEEERERGVRERVFRGERE